MEGWDTAWVWAVWDMVAWVWAWQVWAMGWLETQACLVVDNQPDQDRDIDRKLENFVAGTFIR